MQFFGAEVDSALLNTLFQGSDSRVAAAIVSLLQASSVEDAGGGGEKTSLQLRCSRPWEIEDVHDGKYQYVTSLVLGCPIFERPPNSHAAGKSPFTATCRASATAPNLELQLPCPLSSLVA